MAVEWSSPQLQGTAWPSPVPPRGAPLPLIPGIDLAGTVLESQHPDWRPGDKVVLNGWGVGETHSGGLAERARVQGDWLVPLPSGLSPGMPWPSAPQGTPPCSA